MGPRNFNSILRLLGRFSNRLLKVTFPGIEFNRIRILPVYAPVECVSVLLEQEHGTSGALCK